MTTDRFIVDRQFLIDIDSAASLAAHRGLDDQTKRELVELSTKARKLYEAKDAPDLADLELLAGLMRRIIKDPDRHPADDPFVNLFESSAGGDIIIDGRLGLSAEEVAALERAGAEAHQ